MRSARPATVHACALVIGESGILIRGASGAGKSSLLLALLAAAADRGLFARLVADDRVTLHAAGDRLIAEPHPAIAGLIEDRGSGILPLRHEKQTRITLVVDLAPGGGERLPSASDSVAAVGGVVLPRVILPTESPPETAARRILAKF